MKTVGDLGERELGVTSSMRSTWIWARHSEECELARAVIDNAGGLARWSQATRHGQPVENVTDIDIGMDAYEGRMALEAAGFTLVDIEDSRRP